jgi:uroporphyrinogen-III decarboxylase
VAIGKIGMDKTPEELYRERDKRITDAIQLKIPDRVPLEIALSYFPARYAGITCEAAWYDYNKWLAACKKTLLDFQPDIGGVQSFFPGKVLEYLDPKSLRWPGHGVSPHHSHQAIEGEHMKADEYDVFLGDLSDYMLRVHLPRVSGAMESFSMIPQLSSLGYNYRGALVLAEALTKPEVAGAIKTLQKAGRELGRWRSKMESFAGEVQKLGFPPLSQGAALAPFDAISDNLRGMAGTMLDMYRQPDSLLEACEKILTMTLERIKATMTGGVNNRVGIPLHRGSEGFMSLKQFETFYWPTLKKLIQGIADEGLTPCVFFEGDYTSRLEYLLELPKAKVFGHFDTTDIFRAKEVLKGHMCIVGDVPCSLLQTGTPEDVKGYCQKLIDVVGKDGGFIMSTRSPVDDVRTENLKMMIDFTKEYGVYR